MLGIGRSMRSDAVIQARGLGKAFELYQRPLDRAKQFLLGKRGKYFEEFWAVRDVNLEIRRGESIGIIGRNGAGFSPDLSGRENIYIAATALGLSSAEIKKRFDAIIDFAGLGPFLEQPLRHYSTGR